ncbi:MAG: uroporphyrinogen decarboxylase family protein [Oscillospiraceae bacterium]
MTSKERVLLALNHQEADRVPLDIGGINNTAMHSTTEKAIKKLYGLKDNGTLIRSDEQLISVPDQSVIDFFNIDTCSIYMRENRPWTDNKDGTYKNMWGIDLKLNPDGYYYNMVGHPLENVEDIEDLDSWDFPEPNEYMIEGLSERIDANKDKCCILEGFRECMFGIPSWLRRNENFYVDLVADPELSDALHEKLLDGYIKWIDYVMPRIGSGIDVVKFADDLGTQQSTICNPTTYRERIKPFQKKLYMHVKDKYHKPVLLHSCGAISDIIGDLIDIGVDAINPVQISARGMEPEGLKKRFGSNITFWGGGVDTQHTLGEGTIEQIKAEVKKNMGVFKPNGGFVFTQVHNIQPNVPIENIMAMWEAFKENADYR